MNIDLVREKRDTQVRSWHDHSRWYDTNGFALTVTNAFGTSLQQITTNSYDASGLPLVTTDARGYSSTNTYDTRGLLLNCYELF